MLTNIDQVKKMLTEGKKLVLAAEEKMLKLIPKGDWIGGTIPYFMTKDGGITTRDQIFVQEIPSYAKSCQILLYDENNLSKIVSDCPETGFSIVILPGFSRVHQEYALHASSYDRIFLKAISGWVAGFHLDDLGKTTAKVFAGNTNEISDKKAVALHIELPDNYLPMINIVNIFEQGNGDDISFTNEGFTVSDCLINDEKKNFHDYLLEKKIDTRLPLIANYSGTMINISIQALNASNKTVQLYAPVFAKTTYKMAKIVDNYSSKFKSAIPTNITNPLFSCNCILNYLYGELEGKKTGVITGPMTFGEIAYQLVNQTMVYVTINKIA